MSVHRFIVQGGAIFRVDGRNSQVRPYKWKLLRLLRTFGCSLGEKICMRAVLKEDTANYISLESLINVDFEKNYNLPVSSIPQKKIANNHEDDQVSFN